MNVEIFNDVEKWFENEINIDFFNEHFKQNIEFDEDSIKTDTIHHFRSSITCSEEEVFEGLEVVFFESSFQKPNSKNFKIIFSNRYALIIEGYIEYQIKYRSNIGDWVLTEGDFFLEDFNEQTYEMPVSFEIDIWGRIIFH